MYSYIQNIKLNDLYISSDIVHLHVFIQLLIRIVTF